MSSPASIADYLRNIYEGVITTLVGMSITLRYCFSKTVTVQYPEERMAVAPRYRGIHYLEQDLCIACRQCEKACPIDCIEIRFERHPGGTNEWFEFTVDYNKCMFCELCCSPCPEDCIHMGREYSLVKYERQDLVYDLLTWKGMRDLDHETIAEAQAEKKRKAAEMAAKKKAREEAKAREAADAKAKEAADAKAKEAADAKPDTEAESDSDDSEGGS